MVQMKRKNNSLDGISRKEKAERSENFFQELDEKNSRFLKFWIGIIVILVLVFSAAIYLAVFLKRDKVANNKVNEYPVSFAERLSDLSSGSGKKNLYFHPLEFAEATGANSSDFPLKSAVFIITKDQLLLSGRIKDSLIFWPVSLKLKPEVKDGEFAIKIDDSELQNILIFSEDKKKIESILAENLNSNLNGKSLLADSIVLHDGYIELILIRKK